jgi:hypothetical protein
MVFQCHRGGGGLEEVTGLSEKISSPQMSQPLELLPKRMIFHLRPIVRHFTSSSINVILLHALTHSGQLFNESKIF